MLEFAGGALHLAVVEIEKVVEQYLRQTVPSYDDPRPFFPRLGEPDLIARCVQQPHGGKFLDDLFRLFLLRPLEELGPGVTPFLPEGPYQLEDFVLRVFRHFRDPFENRDRTKFTTFDSGRGKE
jgi:hypothetical protein